MALCSLWAYLADWPGEILIAMPRRETSAFWPHSASPADASTGGHMRGYPLSAGLFLSLVLVACTRDDAPAPTAPPQLHHVSSNATCDRDLARTISGEIGALYKSAAKTEANARWRVIQDLCPAVLASGFNPLVNPNAQNLAVDYFGYFLRQRDATPTRVVGSADDWARHFNHVAIYVNIDDPTYAIEAASFTAAGAIKYCEAGVKCYLETGFPKIAALRINEGATSRPVLATIARAFDSGVCQSENLELVRYCAKIETTPQVTFASPYADVSVCHAAVSDRLAHRLALAHPTPATGDGTTFVELGYPAMPGPDWTFACDPTTIPGYLASAAPMDRGPAARA